MICALRRDRKCLQRRLRRRRRRLPPASWSGTCRSASSTGSWPHRSCLLGFSAVTSDDESRAFAVHGLLGLFIAALVIFRLVWGLIGTRHARFSGFANSPAALAAYLKGILFGPTREYVGHNPASSYVTWAMLILLVGLIWTGLQMGSGNESVEELHEILAHSMLAWSAFTSSA